MTQSIKKAGISHLLEQDRMGDFTKGMVASTHVPSELIALL
ncbi:MAG: hypothetical protein ACTSU4_04830 [Promethearchaeota archaeon]